MSCNYYFFPDLRFRTFSPTHGLLPQRFESLRTELLLRRNTPYQCPVYPFNSGLHLGLSAAGWAFQLWVDPPRINSLADWLVLLEYGRVFDEYDRLVPPAAVRQLFNGSPRSKDREARAYTRTIWTRGGWATDDRRYTLPVDPELGYVLSLGEFS